MSDELKDYLIGICVLLGSIFAIQLVGLVVFCCEVMEIREQVKVLALITECVE